MGCWAEVGNIADSFSTFTALEMVVCCKFLAFFFSELDVTSALEFANVASWSLFRCQHMCHFYFPQTL